MKRLIGWVSIVMLQIDTNERAMYSVYIMFTE